MRSWLRASNESSVVYLWPALVKVVLVVTSVVESFPLVKFECLSLVICTIKAPQTQSWRTRLSQG